MPSDYRSHCHVIKSLLLFNVLIGIFVEHILSISQPADEQVATAWARQKRHMLTEVQRMARYVDSDSSGTISGDKFQSHTTDATSPRTPTGSTWK